MECYQCANAAEPEAKAVRIYTYIVGSAAFEQTRFGYTTRTPYHDIREHGVTLCRACRRRSLQRVLVWLLAGGVCAAVGLRFVPGDAAYFFVIVGAVVALAGALRSSSLAVAKRLARRAHQQSVEPHVAEKVQSSDENEYVALFGKS